MEKARQATALKNAFMSTQQLAHYTGFSISFFEKARARDEGPAFHKLSNKVLYNIEDVDAWVASGRTQTGGPDQ